MSTIGFVTCKDVGEARSIANALLQKKLIACANIINGVESIYWWKGNIQNATEALLILKTNPNKLDQLIPEIQKNHSYELPSIEFINVDHTTPLVQQWINQSLK